MELTAVLSPAEEGGYVAFNPETGTTTEMEIRLRLQQPIPAAFYPELAV